MSGKWYIGSSNGVFDIVDSDGKKQIDGLTEDEAIAIRDAYNNIPRLAPCPFCGGMAIYDTEGCGLVVMCCRCGARTGRVITRATALDSWNRRHGQP